MKSKEFKEMKSKEIEKACKEIASQLNSPEQDKRTSEATKRSVHRKFHPEQYYNNCRIQTALQEFGNITFDNLQGDTLFITFNETASKLQIPPYIIYFNAKPQFYKTYRSMYKRAALLIEKYKLTYTE